MLKRSPLLVLALSVIFCSLPVSAGNTTHDNGVLVTRNADGSIDVADDDGGTAAASSSATGGRVYYRYNAHPGTRNIGGVTVRTNPDGSIETFDSASTPVYSSRRRYVAQKRKVAHGVRRASNAHH